jgi:putative hydrolase of the HAD superfamily
LARTGKRRILVTNSHPETLAIKSEHVPLADYFDARHSSHLYEVPKEHPEFWARFSAREPFDPARTLFVDDSIPVLSSARRFGIANLRAVRRPDTGRPPNDVADYVAIDGVSELLP